MIYRDEIDTTLYLLWICCVIVISFSLSSDAGHMSATAEVQSCKREENENDYEDDDSGIS